MSVAKFVLALYWSGVMVLLSVSDLAEGIAAGSVIGILKGLVITVVNAFGTWGLWHGTSRPRRRVIKKLVEVLPKSTKAGIFVHKADEVFLGIVSYAGHGTGREIVRQKIEDLKETHSDLNMGNQVASLPHERFYVLADRFVVRHFGSLVYRFDENKELEMDLEAQEKIDRTVTFFRALRALIWNLRHRTLRVTDDELVELTRQIAEAEPAEV
ncbi:hypothetical protein FDA94_28545 [Herbidospora galbida]|uniref:DUF4760 domain-containing protein n=1 Tax=Herbidospora galbida TaxID=2575442 RepID=A0A4U3M703_9ACTN|nr:hypothetical protein [Herbidospora galbida]TKK84581.1 hypothetical protein FDA94_28545 [Herbidospora galbida]